MCVAYIIITMELVNTPASGFSSTIVSHKKMRAFRDIQQNVECCYNLCSEEHVMHVLCYKSMPFVVVFEGHIRVRLCFIRW